MLRAFAVAVLLILGGMMVKVWLGSRAVVTGYEISGLQTRGRELSARHRELLYEVNRATSTAEVARRVAGLRLDVLPPGLDEGGWELRESAEEESRKSD